MSGHAAALNSTALGSLDVTDVEGHDVVLPRVLGYTMGERHDAALVGAALQKAIVARGGQVDTTVATGMRIAGGSNGFDACWPVPDAILQLRFVPMAASSCTRSGLRGL